ncbi:MAG: aldehyde:ferredoxin oxidoreductase [Clostridiales bacterium]|nr:aldehyde:ferredoxin oxidoreductase [Clostridiales bacterium]
MYLPHYLKINLNNQTVVPFPIDEAMFSQYLGGKILGAKLLYDLLPAGLDPLSPDAVLIVNTGPMNGTGAPSSSRFNMTFKNVLTGGIASSNCGGQFGVMLKRAGVDGLIITGRSEKPVTIAIVDGEVTFTDATALWGLDTEAVQTHFHKQYGKLVIGPAGENGVHYACAVSGERVAGRGGAGALMGSKRIKALVAFGTKKQPIYNKPAFDRYVKQWVHFLKSHPMTGRTLGRYGSAGLVNIANANNALPTHNFKRGHFEHADAISGETLAETLLVKNSGCISCPIRCERRVMVNDKEVKGPEYETVGLFGANIDNADLSWINAVNYEADILGLDTISLGGTIAFAMELQERGITDFGLSFGNTDGLLHVIRQIAHGKGRCAELGMGSKWLSEKYGVEWLPEEKGDYAIQVSILKDEVIVALDASGTGLHKRGYREIGTEAPMKETLAAGLLIISKWRPNIPLIDPFCGSGTIVIEAALMAQNIAPGLNRTFAFVDWEWIEDSLYKAERTAAYGAIRQEEEISIQGYDKDPKAIRVAKHNAEVAGVDEVIHLQVRDVEAFSTKAPFGSIICNPPYGERLNALSEAEALYRLMGRVFAPYTTWSKYILTSHEGFEALYGERATKNRKLYNGRIKTYFYQYFGKRRPSSEKGPNQ